MTEDNKDVERKDVEKQDVEAKAVEKKDVERKRAYWAKALEKLKATVEA